MQLFPGQIPVEELYMTSNYGYRRDPFTGRAAFHSGVDFAAPIGTEILAAASGVVRYAEFHPQYGYMIDIDHGDGLLTRYAHCSRLFVKAGEFVKRGEKIASVGNTGRSTGPHLHFEVRNQDEPVNPLQFLRRES
jgi:murein DD-endopeptidase MepM/ murein hydrolase activator NlpD